VEKKGKGEGKERWKGEGEGRSLPYQSKNRSRAPGGPMCRVEKQKKHIVKKHNDELPEEQRLLISTDYPINCQ